MIFVRWIINALVIFAATYLVAGIEVSSFYAALLAALIIGLLNAVVRPILVFLTLPITLLTLGFFILIINSFLVWFAGTIVKGFEIHNFWSAFVLAILLWFTSTFSNWLLKEKV
ncbi:MAG: phage holin family protein [bacterium]